MKSMVVYGPKDIRLIEEPMPESKDDDVITEVKFVGVCGTDKSVYEGTIGYLKTGLMKYPIRLGHEWSGIVCRVGKNVTKFKPGDRVCGDNVVTCGKCENCKSGNYAFCENLRALGSVYTWPGAYTQYMCMPEKHMYKLPDSVKLEYGALIEPAATGLYTAVNGRIKPGCTVVVHGTGLIGLVAAQCAKHLGASTVIVTGRKREKLEVARQLGADYTFSWIEEDVTAAILKVTNNKGADSVLESTGAAQVLCASLEQVKSSGTISVIGSYDTLVDGFDADMMVFKNITLTGLNGCPHMFQPMLNMMAAGQIHMEPMVTDIFPLEQAKEALEKMDQGEKRIKILLEV